MIYSNNLYPKYKTNAGFTLAEMLVYLSIFTILVLIIFTFTVWNFRTSFKAKINFELSDNARRAMETVTYEIKKATSVYGPTSVFNNDFGQLSLQIIATSTADEILTYIDFFRCGDSLCLRQEGQSPSAITSSGVRLTKLNFIQLSNSTTSPSVQINLRIETATSTRPEFTDSLELTSTANLRSY